MRFLNPDAVKPLKPILLQPTRDERQSHYRRQAKEI